MTLPTRSFAARWQACRGPAPPAGDERRLPGIAASLRHVHAHRPRHRLVDDVVHGPRRLQHRLSARPGEVLRDAALARARNRGGVLAAYFSRLDGPLMRITNLFLALPLLPLLLMMIMLFRDTLRTTFGPETGIFLLIVFVIGITSWMQTARIVRGDVLALKEREFVTAAHSIGTRGADASSPATSCPTC